MQIQIRQRHTMHVTGLAKYKEEKRIAIYTRLVKKRFIIFEYEKTNNKTKQKKQDYSGRFRWNEWHSV